MREGDAGPAVQHGFADGGDGAGIIDVCAEIAAVIDAAEHPLRIGRDAQQPEPHAIRWRAMNGGLIRAARFEAHGAIPSDRVAHAGLRRGRGDDDGRAEIVRRGEQRAEAGSVNAVIVTAAPRSVSVLNMITRSWG